MFGFLAFNGGSQTHVSKVGDGAVIARAMINTMVAGGSSAITVLLLMKLNARHQKWSLLLSINAALTGLQTYFQSLRSLH